jgi:glycosyltransferase involved in cell wall biosynthesis
MFKLIVLSPYPLNQAPSQRFRFEQYISEIKKNNFEITHRSFLNQQTWLIFYKKGLLLKKIVGILSGLWNRFLLIFTIHRYQIVFIHREACFIGGAFFEYFYSKRNKNIIFDFDDAIWLHDVSKANDSLGWLKKPEKTSKIISFSKLVIAGNAYLADYAKKYNPNVIIIPTTIDTAYHFNKKAKKNSDKITIGWTGSSTTNRHLKILLPVINILKAKFSKHICLVMISNIPLEDTSALIEFKPWNKETEIEDLAQFDIGIMPLPDDEWTRGKCGFKGLQYMALEIPTVMSPVGVNTEIIQDGENGFLAASEEEWIEKLSLLIESPELREKLGKAGRKTVVEKYSVEANKQKYLDAFNSVLNR